MKPTELLREPWACGGESFFRVLSSAALSSDSVEALKGLNLEVRAEGHVVQAIRGGRFDPRRDSDELDVHRGVAVIPVQGYLTRRQYWRGDRAAYDWIGNQIDRAVEASHVRAIALDIDTHGGQAAGLAEISDRIFAARSAKPVAAFAAPFAYSAGYFIASAAGEVHVIEDGGTGSIGTVLTILDWSKYDARVGIEEFTFVASQSPRKNPDPTTDAGRTQIQEEVDGFAQVFVEHVARNRGVTVDQVLSGFGQGGTFVGAAGIDAGLVDQVGTLEAWIEAQQPSSPRIFPAANAANQETDMQTVNISDVTPEWLEANAPDVLQSIQDAAVAALDRTSEIEGERASAAEAERGRIFAIFDVLDGTSHASAFRELATDQERTESDALRLFAEAERKGRDAELDNRAGDEADVKDLEALPPAQGDEKVSTLLSVAKRFGLTGA